MNFCFTTHHSGFVEQPTEESAIRCPILEKNFAMLLNQRYLKESYKWQLPTSRQMINYACVIVKIVKALKIRQLANGMNTRGGLIGTSGMHRWCVLCQCLPVD